MNGKKAKALRKLAQQYKGEARPAGYTSDGPLLKKEFNPKYSPGNGQPKMFTVVHPGTLRNNTGSPRRVYLLIKHQHTEHHRNPLAGRSTFTVADTQVTTRELLRFFRHFQ